MTLTLEIAPDIEAALTEKARRRGVSLAALLLELARREATAPDASEDSFFAELDALAAEFSTTAPPLANDAVARLYAEHGAAQL
jgi:hypothetical protein